MPSTTPRLGLSVPGSGDKWNRTSYAYNLNRLETVACLLSELTDHNASGSCHTDLRTALNNLYSTADGSSGADLIGCTPINGGSANKVQTVLEEQILKHNMSATVDPGPSNNIVQGYKVGSRWLNNTTDKTWICVDNTSGAGVWRELALACSYNDGMERQAVIDGNFQIAQVGAGAAVTSPASATYPVFDMWKNLFAVDSGTPPTIIHSQNTLTPGDLDKSRFAYKINVSGPGSGYGANSYWQLVQYIEHGVRSLCGSGKKVTVKFKAKSTITGKRIGLYLVQNFGTGGSPSTALDLTGATATLTSSWQDFEYTFTTSSLSSKVFGTNNDDRLALIFQLQWGSSYAAFVGAGTAESWVGSGDVYIAQVQLVAGDMSMPFSPKSFQEELRACQRYYEKSYAYNVAVATATSALGLEAKIVPSNTIAAAQKYGKVNFRVSKMTGTPVVTIYPYTTPSNTNRVSNDAGTDLGANSGVANQIGDSGFNVYNNSGGSLTTTANSVLFHWVADCRF